MVKVRLLWPVSHMFTAVCSKICFFRFFNSWKMLKMLKIGCFKQNHCISGMLQGIPMQFFAQQWWKSVYCDQFHTYSQLFTAKFVFIKFSIAGKSSKCLKYAVLSKITVSQACLKVFPCNFFSTGVKVRLLWPVSHIFAVVCSKICFLNFSVAGKSSNA